MLHVISFTLHSSPIREQYYYPHLAEEETEAGVKLLARGCTAGTRYSRSLKVMHYLTE